MLILAIDTALDACAAGVLDTRTGKLIGHESLPLARGHAEALMPLIGRVMQQAGIGFPELYRVAVTTGPGSFTGLRVGLSAARGIALAAGKPAVGISTLTAFAAPLVSESGPSPIISAIDARHGQVYCQMVQGDGSSLLRASVIPVEQLIASAEAHGAPRIIGNAAQLVADAWPAHVTPPVEIIQQAAPDITWIGWLGAAVNPDTAPAKPYYLRAPDAKPLATAPAPAPAP